MEKTGAERRVHPRAPISTSAYVSHGDGLGGPYRVCNLSAGGALLAGEPRLDLGVEVGVLLQMLDGSHTQIAATVVRHQLAGEGSYAVCFKDLDPDVEDAIQTMVLTHLENAGWGHRKEPKRGEAT